SLPGRRGCASGAKLPERHQREVVTIEMVAKIEVPRKAGAGKRLLAPGAVGRLRAHEPIDPARDGGSVRSVAGQQPEGRPCALPPAGAALAAVRSERLPPAPIEVLARPEPVDGAPDPRRGHVLPDPLEPGEGAPRAVDEVAAPAAPPAAVGTLGPAQIFDAAL